MSEVLLSIDTAIEKIHNEAATAGGQYTPQQRAQLQLSHVIDSTYTYMRTVLNSTYTCTCFCRSSKYFQEYNNSFIKTTQVFN